VFVISSTKGQFMTDKQTALANGDYVTGQVTDSKMLGGCARLFRNPRAGNPFDFGTLDWAEWFDGYDGYAFRVAVEVTP
jgi:hypothetical protein